MTPPRPPAISVALITCLGLVLAGCAGDVVDRPPVDSGAVASSTSVDDGPCGLIERLGDGLLLQAEPRDWSDLSTLLTPALATWGLDELRAEPANSNVNADLEWAHHLSATVRGRTQGSLLAIAATDPARREGSALLLAAARERIDRRDRKLPPHLSLNVVLLAEPDAGAWTEQVAGLLVQRPISLRRVGVTVVVDGGPESAATNRDELRPILDELAAEQGLPIGEFDGVSTIPATLGEVGLAVVVLSLDLEPLGPCDGADAARLERNLGLVDALLDKLDGALGFDLPDQ